MRGMERYLHPRLEFSLADEAATAAMARQVARLLVGGDLIKLVGDLGAGKSTFSRYVLEALGHVGDVPSPTYTLVQLYDATRIPVAHMDCYRLQEPEELLGLGLEDYVKHGVVLAEWPDKAGGLLDAPREWVEYHVQSLNNPGTLTVTLHGEGVARRVVLEGSMAWQRRFALMDFSDITQDELPVMKRSVTEEGRRAFLERCNVRDYTMQALGGDWSGRSYARITLADGTTRMLMDGPPPQEGVARYAEVADYYRSAGLRAAEIYARDDAEGYLLHEDFGTRQLLEVVNGGVPQEPWYGVAVDVLAHLCRATPMAGGRAATREYQPFDWLVEVKGLMDWGYPLAFGRGATAAERSAWFEAWLALYPLVDAMPRGMMPWDYQATNMMLLGDNATMENFGLIDIQDARHAPVVQDLSILLRDIRRGQDDALEDAMLVRACDALNVERAALQRAFEVANLHHCCRIMGGLCRQLLRDGKTAGYEKFMTRLWQVATQSFSCTDVAQVVNILAPMKPLLLNKIPPTKAA